MTGGGHILEHNIYEYIVQNTICNIRGMLLYYIIVLLWQREANKYKLLLFH